LTTNASLRFKRLLPPPKVLLIADLIINLGFKVEDNIIVIFANNLNVIPREVRVANATFSISSPTGRIFSIKSTLRVKKGLAKRVNFKRS
jgi:hypothetical protein